MSGPSMLAGGGSSGDSNGLGKDLIQTRDEQTGPGLEIRPLGEHVPEFVGLDQTTLEQVPFTDFDGALDRDQLDHAYVYRSYRVGVIVKDAQAPDDVRASYGHLLRDLPARSRVDRTL